MWRSYISIPIENQDPFKELNEGSLGIIICFNKITISVVLMKDNLNKSELIGNNLRIVMNTKRCGFDIFENNLEKPNFMSYELFSSRIIFKNDIFFVELDHLNHTNLSN
jgi:hypothetical protein